MAMRPFPGRTHRFLQGAFLRFFCSFLWSSIENVEFASAFAWLQRHNKENDTVPVLFEFGYGLSYTKFEHSLTVSAPPPSSGSIKRRSGYSASDAAVTVTVRNVGSIASATIVLLFGQPPRKYSNLTLLMMVCVDRLLVSTADASNDVGLPMPAPPQQVLLGFEKLSTIQPGATVMHKFELATHDAMALR